MSSTSLALVQRLSLPQHTWLPLGLATVAPIVLWLLTGTLSQRKARGIATVIAVRTIVILSLGFAILATVATVSVIQTGLRELRERNVAAVRTLARDLQQMPLGFLGPSAPFRLTLFRAKYPAVRFVAVSADGCRTDCLIGAGDQQRRSVGSTTSELSRAWPTGNVKRALASMGGESVLLIAEPVRDAASAKNGVVVVGVDAEYLDVQATRTAWVILAIAYSLVLVVGWSSWRQLNSSLASRIDAVTRQIRAGSVSAEPSEGLRFAGKELRELSDAAQAYIQTTLEEQKSSDERYRRLVELAPDGILICSATGIKFANSAAVALAGVRTRNDVIGKPIATFIEFEPMRAGDPVPGALRPAKWTRVDGSVLHVEVAEITSTGREATTVSTWFVM